MGLLVWKSETGPVLKDGARNGGGEERACEREWRMQCMYRVPLRSVAEESMQAICKLLLGAARKNRGRDGNKTIAIRIVQEDCGKEREGGEEKAAMVEE